MDIDSILTLIISAFPAVASVVTVLAAMLKIFKNFDELKKSVKDNTDLQQFRDQLNKVLEENYQLKELLCQYIDKENQHPQIKAKEE